MRPTRDELRELLRLVAATAPRELDCDEFLARVGSLLEAWRGGVPDELRDVAQHLEVCPECLEEFEALLALRLDGDPDAPASA